MPRRKPSLDVDLLPENHRRHRLQLRQLLLVLALVAAVVLTIPMHQAVCGAIGECSRMKAELSVLNQKAAAKRDAVQERAEMVAISREYETIMEKRGVITRRLGLFSTAADETGLDISSVWHSDGEGKALLTCQVIGQPTYEETIAAFQSFCSLLEETGEFYSVTRPRLDYPARGLIEVEVIIEEPTAPEKAGNPSASPTAYPKQTSDQ